MNCKNLLGLIAVSATLTPILTFSFNTANAFAEGTQSALTPASVSCDAPNANPKVSGFKHDRSILMASAGGVASDDAIVDFTDAESDAAVTLFGCDCPACMRSLKQLQFQSMTQQVLGSGAQGHCWTALQRKVSPDVVKEVLKNLEAQKIN